MKKLNNGIGEIEILLKLKNGKCGHLKNCKYINYFEGRLDIKGDEIKKSLCEKPYHILCRYSHKIIN